jgi:hypothetical protein
MFAWCSQVRLVAAERGGAGPGTHVLVCKIDVRDAPEVARQWAAVGRSLGIMFAGRLVTT